MKKTYEEGYVAGFSHNTEVIVNLETELDSANSKVSELSNRILKAIEEIKYFELQANHLDDNIYLDKTLTNKLLEILKGVDR